MSSIKNRVGALEELLKKESGDSLRLMENIEDNPICSVTIDKTVPCIKVVWKRYATSVELRYVHEVVLNLLRKHGLKKILGDDTALPTIHEEDQVWITKDWMPRAIVAGLRVTANKSPESYYGKLSVQNVQSVMPSKVSVRSFGDLNDARAWLAQVKAA